MVAPSSRLLDAEPVLLLMALSLRGLEVHKKLLRVRFTVGRRVLQRLITKKNNVWGWRGSWSSRSFCVCTLQPPPSPSQVFQLQE